MFTLPRIKIRKPGYPPHHITEWFAIDIEYFLTETMIWSMKNTCLGVVNSLEFTNKDTDYYKPRLGSMKITSLLYDVEENKIIKNGKWSKWD